MSRFKILWIDDQPEKCKRAQRAVKAVIESFGFEPDIDLESNISNESLTSPDGVLYKKIHGRDADLFIIDYNLKNNVLGNHVIGEIRKENEIYSDIIFYSSMRAELINTVTQSFVSPDSVNYLDGVYIAPLDDFFTEKVTRVINKIIKSWYNVHSIRGIILSKASKFEHMVGEIINLGYQPCLPVIKEKLCEKGENVKRTTQDKWNKVNNREDPVPFILKDPINFNWTTKKLMFYEMAEKGIITLNAKAELDEIFKLRNDFAHNPIHLVDGVLELKTPKKTITFTESDVEEIRGTLVAVENDLQTIAVSIKSSPAEELTLV